MVKFTESEMEGILQKLRNKKNVNISKSSHFIKRIKEREKYCNYDTIYNIINNSVPLNIEFSEDNKFRITYEHTDNYNLVVVIFIKSISEIRLVTTFPEEKEDD
ncbi:MAG: hypothetical protein LBT10_01575 [Methanobrevibacter sp.]|jgi:hypothetical protein|nr:hypothetical protein [Methanobrevibacter sp.]